MSKAKEKIDNRMAYHLQQLAQLRAKKKEEESKEKVAERKKRASKNILLGSSICKVLNIDYTEIDEYLPKIIGLLYSKEQHINNPAYLLKGNELLESWKNGGDRNE
ncbi:hypothetical protein LJ781_004675 [Salmonella enterica]|nr:hypothetical protein [Salmonella enterica]EIK4776937.1 hypothetical protein [Salmonella enterica]